MSTVSNSSLLCGIDFDKVGLVVHTSQHPNDPESFNGDPFALDTCTSPGISVDGTFLQPQLETEAGVSSSHSNRRSDVLKFVKQCDDLRRACQHCCLIWRNKNTHTIRTHLFEYHSDVYRTRLGKAVQTVLGADKKRKLDKDGRVLIDKAIADTRLVDFIVNGSQSFSSVEQTDFIAFCSELNDKYIVPGRTAIREEIMHRHTLKKLEIKIILSQCDRYLSFTTDMWTSISRRGYMVITGHSIDNEWVMRHLLICFVRVMFPHTAECLAQYFCEALREMNVLEKLWTVTTDNAYTDLAMMSILKNRLNNDRALPLSEDCLMHCLAHVLHLAINDARHSVPILDDAIGHLRDVTKKFVDSPKLLEALQHICTDLGMTYISLVLDVDTRGNSTWEMVYKQLQMQRPIEEVLRRLRDQMNGYCGFSIRRNDKLALPIPSVTWRGLSGYHTFLAQFRSATTGMSASEYPTLSMAISVFKALLRSAQYLVSKRSSFTSSHASELAATVVEKLPNYESNVVTEMTIIASLLDPRTKRLVGKFTSLTADQQRYHSQSGYRDGDFDTNEIIAVDTPACAQVEGFSSSFISMFDDIERENDVSESETIDHEIAKWMTFAHKVRLNQDANDVLLFWKKNKMFPRLKQMARHYLSITSTSVPNKQAFSHAGCVLTKGRARLCDESVEVLIELQLWNRFSQSYAKKQ